MSRNRRTSSPASGNWCRTHGGITELPPDTDSQARAYASLPTELGASDMTIRASCRQEAPSRRARIDEFASVSDGLGEHLMDEKKISNPSPPSAVVSQCQAVSRSVGASLRALHWLARTLQSQPCVQFGVVDAAAPELAVLIVLDQVVIGVSWEGQGVEPQGIDRRHSQ